MIKCVDAYDASGSRAQCTDSTARSARHTTMPADETQLSLMRFTDGQHEPRILQTIRKGHAFREYITRSLRIVRNDKIYHGQKDTQVVKKVSLITFVDRHHGLTTCEYNRRLERQERTTREYSTDHYTIHTDRQVTFTTRYNTWYWTILAELGSKNKKEKKQK